MDKKAEEVLEILKTIQASKESNAKSTTKDKNAHLRSLKYFPALAGFVKYINKVGFDMSESLDASRVATGFHLADLALALIKFIWIPLSFLIAFLQGKKVSMTLSKTGSWFYAAVILGLGITMLLLPGVRELCALILAIAVAGAAVIGLANFYYERGEVEENLKATNEEIQEQEEQLELLRQQAKNLQNRFEDKKRSSNDELLYREFIALNERYEWQCQSLQNLYNLKAQYAMKLEAMDNSKVKDKCLGVLLASIGLIGAVVAIFFPPVGFGIIGITGLIGLGYTLTRLLAPSVNTLISKIKSKFKTTPPTVEEEVKEEKEVQLKVESVPTQKTTKPFVKKDVGIPGIMEDYFTHHQQTHEKGESHASLQSANAENDDNSYSQHH